jgi:hypothetical protein
MLFGFPFSSTYSLQKAKTAMTPSFFANTALVISPVASSIEASRQTSIGFPDASTNLFSNQ